MMSQATSQIAARTIDELCAAASDCPVVVDAGFIVNVTEGMNSRSDAILDVSHQRL